MNKVVLMGRLTKDPEVRYTQSSEPIAVARYVLAVNKKIKRDGESEADFISCVALGKSGEFAERNFKKGMLVCVSGRVSTRSWDDEKTGKKRYATDIVLEEQNFAESKATTMARANKEDSYMKEAEEMGNRNENLPDGFSDISDESDSDLPL